MSPCVRRVRKICNIRFFDEFSRKLSRSLPRRDARSVNNARGSLPQRGWTLPSWKFGAEGPTEWGPHGPPRTVALFILGAKLAPSSHFFAMCLRFLRAMFRSCVFYRFPMVFEWILGGLGQVLGVFWTWFFTRFSNFTIL